jgi:hypothetical protein
VAGPPLQTLRDGNASIVLDDGAWPLVVTTWFGAPTERLVDGYFEAHAALLARARQDGEAFVMITDALDTDRPSATARKRVTDHLQRLPPDTTTLLSQTYVVIGSALIRGAFTALAWVDRRLEQVEVVATPAEGIERASALLRQSGRPPTPLDPRRYVRPARP